MLLVAGTVVGSVALLAASETRRRSIIKLPSAEMSRKEMRISPYEVRCKCACVQKEREKEREREVSLKIDCEAGRQREMMSGKTVLARLQAQAF